MLGGRRGSPLLTSWPGHYIHARPPESFACRPGHLCGKQSSPGMLEVSPPSVLLSTFLCTPQGQAEAAGQCRRKTPLPTTPGNSNSADLGTWAVCFQVACV